jgi:hypothetical protein
MIDIKVFDKGTSYSNKLSTSATATALLFIFITVPYSNGISQSFYQACS